MSRKLPNHMVISLVEQIFIYGFFVLFFFCAVCFLKTTRLFQLAHM